jgi:hypothetical protein
MLEVAQTVSVGRDLFDARHRLASRPAAVQAGKADDTWQLIKP